VPLFEIPDESAASVRHFSLVHLIREDSK